MLMCESRKERAGFRRLKVLLVMCWVSARFVAMVRLKAAQDDVRSINSFLRSRDVRHGSLDVQSDYARRFDEPLRRYEGLLL